MQEWLKTSLTLCGFGFLKEIRPSEPYITEYLLGDWNGRNITDEQLNRDVFPVGTYSNLSQLIIVFLITDFLRYKPLIVVSGISGIILWSMLSWTSSLEALQVVEFFYGTYMATEVAYLTYIYAKVDKKYYSKVSSHTRIAMLVGKLVASIAAQLLVYYKIMDYKELNYITLATQIAATLWVFLLPKVKTSLYFHRESEIVKDDNQKNNVTGIKLIWNHFTTSYSNIKVVQWSIWYAVGLSGMYQVYSYIQILWKVIEPNPEVAWNAGVDGVQTFIGALFALAAGYIHHGKMNPTVSLMILSILSVLEGGAILLSTWSYNLYASYAGFIIFGSLYAFTITVASAEVARYLDDESYGLVFGFNTFIALILQTLMNVLFISGSIFKLDIIQQYTVYSFYFIGIGGLYLIFTIYEFISLRKHKTISISE